MSISNIDWSLSRLTTALSYAMKGIRIAVTWVDVSRREYHFGVRSTHKIVGILHTKSPRLTYDANSLRMESGKTEVKGREV